MSKKDLNLVKKLGTLLVVGLILVSHSPVTALAADDVSAPENQTPTVENVATNNDQAPAVVEESAPIEEQPATQADVESDITPDTTNTPDQTVETVQDVQAVEAEVVETPVVSETPAPEDKAVEVTPAPSVAAVIAPAVVAPVNTSFAISDEFGGNSSAANTNTQTTPTPTNNNPLVVSPEIGGQTSTSNTNGQGTFTTLPDNGEGSFNTLPNDNGCTSGCGGSQNTGDQGSFTTLPGDTNLPASAEGSFTTQNNGGGGGGGGCESNCGGGGGSSGGGYSLGGSAISYSGSTPLPLPCELYLKKFIKLGANNDPVEVRKLEAFLNVFEGFNLPVDGVYDQADYEAVKIFQQRYASAVLTPWGITDPTGYVYITTTLTINQIYCHHTVGNDLDLSTIYPVYGPAVENGVKPVEGLMATTTPTTTPSLKQLPALFQAAAVGALNFIKDWWCLIIIILLILIIAYLLDERERLARELDKQKKAKPIASDQTVSIGEVIAGGTVLPLVPPQDGEEEWVKLDKTEPDLDPSQEPLTKL